MKIKGTSVLSTLHFVKTKFPSQIQIWIESLPEDSKKIFSNPIIAAQWYAFIPGMIEPTEKIGEMFYNGDKTKTAYETGKFSAEEGLKGIYKIFVKIASTKFVLRKTSQIFNTYYDGASMEILEQTDNTAVFKVLGIQTEGRLFFERLKGWMEKTIEIVNNKPIAITTKETTNSFGNIEAIVTAKWQ
jgi:hypothetical protein